MTFFTIITALASYFSVVSLLDGDISAGIGLLVMAVIFGGVVWLVATGDLTQATAIKGNLVWWETRDGWQGPGSLADVVAVEVAELRSRYGTPISYVVHLFFNEPIGEPQPPLARRRFAKMGIPPQARVVTVPLSPEAFQSFVHNVVPHLPDKFVATDATRKFLQRG